jgi:hypothetical protein
MVSFCTFCMAAASRHARVSGMRSLILFLAALLAACASPTEPVTPWQDAEWVAVRANGQPLPYTTPGGVRIDSLRIVFTTSQPLDQFTAWSYAGSTSDGITTRVTAVAVWSEGARVAPIPPPFRLDARVVRDTLQLEDFAGADWRLVRR